MLELEHQETLNALELELAAMDITRRECERIIRGIGSFEQQIAGIGSFEQQIAGVNYKVYF